MLQLPATCPLQSSSHPREMRVAGRARGGNCCGRTWRRWRDGVFADLLVCTDLLRLTPAEEAQRMRRKEQNRRAARRFRQNRKLRESVLEEEISNLEVKNAGLRDKIKELQQLKDLLLQHVTAHFIKHHLPDSPQSGVGHPPRGLPDAMLRLPRCLPAFDKPETH
ncbi:proto-oncogene c-Fos-like isoform X2 [Pomacea canaliculata]|uniref:proto-oncogene c-Fos-like isoform X2 n=1 Tax=Pomacea canaliculata TaxID=400727 RepID=UPI000D735CAF|nr:proto-oncogene c-Fos-like isoform X2 [Pomacea canaliculata]